LNAIPSRMAVLAAAGDQNWTAGIDRQPLVPRTRDSRTSGREFDRELRVQRGTRIIELPVVLDSEVRIRTCRKCWRTSESDHQTTGSKNCAIALGKSRASRYIAPRAGRPGVSARLCALCGKLGNWERIPSDRPAGYIWRNRAPLQLFVRRQWLPEHSGGCPVRDCRRWSAWPA
jgi:hypothetical protein